jgi:phosphoglycerol transferase MdoB-like AlkP superfamily enzyme
VPYVIASTEIDRAPIGQSLAEAWHGSRSLRLAGRAALYLVVSLAVVFCVELLARQSTGATVDFFLDIHRPAWTTVLFYALVMGLLDALLGRRLQSLLVVAPIAVALAWTGQQKNQYLGDPLYPADFLYAHQIVDLLPLLVRERPMTAVGIVVGVVVLVALIVFLWRFWRRHTVPLAFNARLARLVIAVPALAYFVSIMDYSNFSWVRDRLQIIPMMWDQKENYAFNGFTMAFALNIPMANVPAPVGFNADALAGIGKTPAIPVTLPAQKPDIIIVMSESYWDPTLLPGVEITPDPIPTTRANLSGHVFSPEFGGMTANVEFEALTGFSNAFLPYGSIPYQQYVRRPIPTLATFFNSQGYHTEAIHPGTAWFWNRSVVYEDFGFDEFLSEENLPPMELKGPLASDAAMTDEVIRRADASEDPFFFFVVSLQNHGPYAPYRYAQTTHEISAPGISEWARQSTLSYAEGAADADKGLARLIEWAQKRERPTVIAFFGDHLPPLGPVYVETGFMKEPVANRRAPLDDMKAEHETPLVIWSNRGGTVEDIGAISPAFLPLAVLKTAGIAHPYYTDFLGDIRQQYSVVDRNMLLRSDGEQVKDWARAKEIDPSIRDFRYLQYDIMFGDRKAKDRFFPDEPGRTPMPGTLIGNHFEIRQAG